MVETIEQKLNETSEKGVDKSKSNFLKYLAGGLIAGALGFSAGCGFSKYASFGVEPRINGEKAPIKSSLEVVSNGKGVVSDDEDLEERANKYADTLVYVKDINSGDYELRMKTDKLNEKHIEVYISMKGVDYNRKEGYISFGSEFEDRESYNSMKDIAILHEFSGNDNISDQEKEFIKENSPWAYHLLFLFEESEMKTFEESEIKKEESSKSEDYPFIEGLIGGLFKFYLNARLQSEQQKMAKEIEKIDIVKGLTGGYKDYLKKSEDIKRDVKKGVEDAPAPDIDYTPPIRTFAPEEAPPAPQKEK